MAQSPDHIEREVEQNRARVESTLDALKDRMSVNQIVDEVSQFVGVSDMRGLMDSAGRQVRDNPVALGMIGLGLAWLAFGGSSSPRDDRYSDYGDHDDEFGTRSYDPYGGGARYRAPREGVVEKVRHAVSGAAASVTKTAAAAGEKVSDAFGSVRDRAADLGHDVSDRAGQVRDEVHDRAGHWREEMGGRSDRLRSRIGGRAGSMRDRGDQWRGRAADGASHMRENMVHRIEQHPLLIGAAAVAMGAVIGAAMPRTRTEDRWMGESRDRLWEETKSGTAEVRDRAMSAARETYGAAMDAAREEGLVPEEGETLAGKVGRVAEAAVSEAKAQVDPVLHGDDEGKGKEGQADHTTAGHKASSSYQSAEAKPATGQSGGQAGASSGTSSASGGSFAKGGSSSASTSADKPSGAR